MMLGVTSGRGNTLDEVLAYLERSAAADATHPKGTIYFVKNSNIRSTVRDEIFPTGRCGTDQAERGRRDPRRHLAPERERRARAGDGHGRLRLEGLGQHDSARRLCDNFTSFGGVMLEGAGQTPLKRVSPLRARPARAAR